MTGLAILNARDLAHRDFPPVKFLVPGLVPFGLTLLGGRPKVGKSWAALGLAIAVATGGMFLGRRAAQGRALYLALEDNEPRLKHRLALAMGGAEAPDALDFATMCPGIDGSDGGAVAALRAWAIACEKPSLIVVDVVQRIRPAIARNEMLYSADYAALLPLKSLADELGIAIVGIVHTRKATTDESGDRLDAISGTLGLVGAADHTLVLSRGAAGFSIYGRGRDVEEVDLAVAFDGSRGQWRTLGDAAEVSKSETRQTILSALREVECEMSPSEIAEATGLSHDVVRARLRAMLASGEIVQPSRGLYSLPGGPKPSNRPHTNRHDHTNRDRESDDGNGCDGGRG